MKQCSWLSFVSTEIQHFLSWDFWEFFCYALVRSEYRPCFKPRRSSGTDCLAKTLNRKTNGFGVILIFLGGIFKIKRPEMGEAWGEKNTNSAFLLVWLVSFWEGLMQRFLTRFSTWWSWDNWKFGLQLSLKLLKLHFSKFFCRPPGPLLNCNH